MAKGLDFIKSIANSVSKTNYNSILESNKAINRIKSLKDNPGEYFSGVKTLWNDKYDASNYSENVLKKAGINSKEDINNLNWANKLKLAHLNQDGTWNKKAIAGSAFVGYTGISSGERLISGGGLYRDDDGNFDVIGLPLI